MIFIWEPAHRLRQGIGARKVMLHLENDQIIKSLDCLDCGECGHTKKKHDG
jgi:hypothetical protein